ncbi:MAG TPA: hypothetical protein VGT02_05885 [Methylomirabilota bacterium]|jgi:hypothetical protein|nr:hypothetical protein [Methylomirabilota bacterium]
MRSSWGFVVSAGALVVLAAGPASAWQCPVQWKAAEEAIKKSESMKVPPEGKAMLEDAKRMIAESKKHHTEGTTKVEHARSMWKAKAALAIAESVATISEP